MTNGRTRGVNMKPAPDLYDRLRADAVRAAQSAPRRGRNPYEPQDTSTRGPYRDETANTAIANVMREQRNKDPRS